MKKNHLMMAFVAIIALFSASCNESYSELDRIEPTPQPTPQPDPTPDPEPTFIWNDCMDQTVKYYEENDSVIATNIWQVTENSEHSFVPVCLKYLYEVNFRFPTRVVVESQDPTVDLGGGLLKSELSDFTRVGYDSIWTVNSYIDGGYRTNYYSGSLKTVRKDGRDLRGGKITKYKNVTETPKLTTWSDPMSEVFVDDSLINREPVHHRLDITLTSDKGEKWVVTREVVVLVDHFVKKKESEPEPEPEHNHPDWWGEPIMIIGQGTFVYKPGVGADGQGQFFKNINILFENVLVCATTKSYVKDDYSPMDFDWDNAVVYTIGSTLRGKTITSKNVTDLNSVIWRDGKWEAALCNYDQKNFSWTYMSPDGYDQGMTEHLAETCGLKNFAGKHTARLHPSLFYSASLSNGTLTIKDDNGGTIKSFH